MSTIFLFNCFFWTTGVSNLLLGLGGPYIGFLTVFLTDSTTGDLGTDGIALPEQLLSLLATPAPNVFTRGGDSEPCSSTLITFFSADIVFFPSSVTPLSVFTVISPSDSSLSYPIFDRSLLFVV